MRLKCSEALIKKNKHIFKAVLMYIEINYPTSTLFIKVNKFDIIVYKKNNYSLIIFLQIHRILFDIYQIHREIIQ